MDDLYRELILDHYREPRNKGSLDPADISYEEDNPLCGDRVHLDLRLDEDNRVVEVAWQGEGCAISMASASIMTELVKHKSIQEAKQLVQNVLETMRGNKDPDTLDEYDDLAALKGVIKFPVRVKCATLSWHALQEALNQKNNS